MRDLYQERSVKRIGNALGAIAVIFVMTICTCGQRQNHRKQQTGNTLNEGIVKAIAAHPIFQEPETIGIPAYGCSEEMIQTLQGLGILNENRKFTAKGLQIRQTWGRMGDDNTPVYVVLVGRREVVRVLSVKTLGSMTVARFEWRVIPNDMGTALHTDSSIHVGTATFEPTREHPIIRMTTDPVIAHVPNFTVGH